MSLRALFYLDAHRAQSIAYGIFRAPLRLLFWSFLVACYALFAWGRYARQNATIPELREPFAMMLGGMLLIVTGILLWVTIATQQIPIGASKADLYWLTRSTISERLIIAWLQMRRLLLTIVRSGVGLLSLIPFFGPAEVSGAALAAVGVPLLVGALRLPVYLVARRYSKLATLTFVIMIGLGVATDSLAALSTVSSPHTQLPTWMTGIGSIVLYLWHGNGIALFVLYSAIVLIYFAGILRARDLYPELYDGVYYRSELVTVSNQQVDRTTLPRAFRWIWLISVYPAISVEIWKQFALLRNRRGRMFVAIAIVATTVLSVLAALAIKVNTQAGLWISATVAIGLMLLPVLNDISLSNDLSKPLWWMGKGSVFAKLSAWVFARAIVLSVFLSFALLIASLMLGGYNMLVLLLSVAVWIVPFAFRAISLVSYVVLPSAVDQVGPGVLLRAALIFVAITLAAIMGGSSAVITGSPGVGALAGMVVLGLLGILSIGAVASAISDRGGEFAVAERV